MVWRVQNCIRRHWGSQHPPRPVHSLNFTYDQNASRDLAHCSFCWRKADSPSTCCCSCFSCSGFVTAHKLPSEYEWPWEKGRLKRWWDKILLESSILVHCPPSIITHGTTQCDIPGPFVCSGHDLHDAQRYSWRRRINAPNCVYYRDNVLSIQFGIVADPWKHAI